MLGTEGLGEGEGDGELISGEAEAEGAGADDAAGDELDLLDPKLNALAR